MSLSALLLAPACSDKSRRLNEAEALRYKHQLLLKHGHEISSAQVDSLGMHPARTEREIDAYLEQLKAEHAREIEADKAKFESSRKKNAPASSPPGGGSIGRPSS